jgi:hypothetical protein
MQFPWRAYDMHAAAPWCHQGDTRVGVHDSTPVLPSKGRCITFNLSKKVLEKPLRGSEPSQLEEINDRSGN